MAGGANPPSVVISPVGTDSGRIKDTLKNILETKEFTASMVTMAMRERMNLASIAFDFGVSEWEKAGFEPAPSTQIRPPFVAESPIALECRLFQHLSHGDGPLSANYLIGEVVAFHLTELSEIQLIGRLGGDDYVEVSEHSTFKLPRP
jgi:flavin reductase (DIM6/NTAB) family NADH-FMN oxidoreductase RutF